MRIPARLRNWAALNPLASLALVAVAAIIVAEAAFLFVQDTTLFCMAAVACLAMLLLPQWTPSAIPVGLVFASIHVVGLQETLFHPLRDELLGKDRVEAILTGSLMPAAEAGGGGGDGSRQQVTITASDIRLPGDGRQIHGTAKLRGWMTPHTPLPDAGTYEIAGRLRLARAPTNPGQFDSAAYALRQGFVAEVDVRTVRLVEVDPLPLKTWLLQAAERSRTWIEQQLAAGIEDDEQVLALVSGMVLGVTDETSAELQRPFRNSGTLHVFSVSGFHVALISGIGWAFLHFLGVRRSVALMILVPGVFAYAFITGWRPAAARAAIMISVVLAAAILDRKSRIQNSLGAAVLILLAADTHPLFTAGFQLSFGVLLAIALLGVPLLGLCRPWTGLDPFLPVQVASWRQQKWSWLKTWVAGSMCTSLAATAGSLPLTLWHFGLVTPVAIVANCLLILLASFVLAIACVSLLLAVLHLGNLVVITNNANWLFARLMYLGAAFFADLPGAWFAWQTSHATSDPEAAQVTVCHLPYGEAAIHLQDGQDHWLIDSGTRRSFGRVVQPLLQLRGTESLGGLVLTHSDIDHVGGAVRAFTEHECRLAYLSVLEPWSHESGISGIKRFLAAQGDAPDRVRFLSNGDSLRLGRQSQASVLYPSPKDRHDRADDRALVLLVDFHGFLLLFCNDSGFIAEKKILERNLLKTLRCDVLIRNQHAADWSALPEFLLATRPRIIISSNSPFSAEDVMPPSLAEYAEKKHAMLFDQNIHGAVILQSAQGRLTATSFVTGEKVTLRPQN